jgi:dihydrofolate reductase
MRNAIIFNMITADGYFEGPDHELDWHNVDSEFNDFAISQLEEADTLVFGRRTFDMMAGYWSTKTARENDPAVSVKMNDTDKLVFSHTHEKTEWEHTTVISENAMEQFKAIKAKPGKALLTLGSSNLCVQLLEASLVDEVRLMVNPIVLGTGHSMFAGLSAPQRFQLIDTRAFSSGNVLLRYSIAP